ncbi:MAG: DEAD/DEAH box helicase family protein [Methylococcales bacterium]|nr:DEAD/DEAH box helicase family protein [Methylococcales bacterium]
MSKKTKKRSFHEELVLNQWMMSHFISGELATLKGRLGEDRHEGINDDGQTQFFHELQFGLFEDLVSANDLRRYDLNIVQHWQDITHQRNKDEGTVLNMKYFQYLSLLFTEIYLDKYFNHRELMLVGLNQQMDIYNQAQDKEHQFQAFDTDELNKLAFWNATGSGKTLLLHVNLKQYLHYFQKNNANAYPDNIILLTPNEGLSRQHLDELHLSGFTFYQLFDKNKNSQAKTIQIIDINKLGDVMGEKTVAVDAFEGNNLVLIDEGHLGTGTAAGVWMSRRESLTRGGFAFEYSATFGQAVAKGLTVDKAEQDIKKAKAKTLFGKADFKKLSDEQSIQLILNSDEKRKARTLATREIYAKSVLFDYSYKYFYDDGYGKESLILNLKDDDYGTDISRQYFTACLLSFYQQQYLWNNNRTALAEFNIEKPLWVFVGNTVSGEDSDILSVLKYIAGFLNDEAQTKVWLKDLITNTARLLDPKGNNIFNNRFTPLMQLDVDDVYRDILEKLFNTTSRQRLKIVNIKNTKGELALKVGEAQPFGLINIGDDADLFKEAGKPENIAYFDTETDDFGQSQFHQINKKDSYCHILIGSRKFTEGWSSWRVSTMGLLNMGKGEGSQIIQLFGRGVRLKGKDYSLKRTKPSKHTKGLHLERLETLNIFGVNAGYMAQFKDYLKEEGITTPDEILELDFKTTSKFPDKLLKTLQLKDGYKDNQMKGFKRTNFPSLYEIPEEFKGKIKSPKIELDLYPKLEAITTKSISSVKTSTDGRYSGKISQNTMVLFDFDRIYLAIQEFKQLRSWSNLRLERSKLIKFCLKDDHWYTLYIPKAELDITKISDIKKQEDILIHLLKDMTERFYKALKNAYEGKFYDIVTVTVDDDLIQKNYHFEIENTDDGLEYKSKIEKLQLLINEGKLGEASQWQAGQMVAICFQKHLYQPLFAIDGDIECLKMRPLSFDVPSEANFVKDLEAFYNAPISKPIIGNRHLYLLRNADTKSKGLGFALAGNFYPDFLLWLVDNETGQQWLSFIDPKGLRQMNLSDPKLKLHKEVKLLQADLGDPKLTLNSFIISQTDYIDLLNVTVSQVELENENVLFQDSNQKYLVKMFEKILEPLH